MSNDFKFDAIVIGAGHAGIEAGLALSRLGKRTLVLAMSLESVGFMACNPSIGGTAKGHLVREIDALGGEMGLAADRTLLQLRMLNDSKGFAVQSLRGQVDKYAYHRYMKSTLENAPNLYLREGEVMSISPQSSLAADLIPSQSHDSNCVANSGITGKTKDYGSLNTSEFDTDSTQGNKNSIQDGCLDQCNSNSKKDGGITDKCGSDLGQSCLGTCQDKSVCGEGYVIKTRHLTYYAKTVVVCCGVYLKSKILIGSSIEEKGPSGFMRSAHLSDSLAKLGVDLMRFKTGTPARLKKGSLRLQQLEVQSGGVQPYSFSELSKKVNTAKTVCYLGYTNLTTHKIIAENLSKTPRKLGNTEGIGARYCPSIEDKIERFDRDRHSFFLEPEGEGTQEMYIQGISTSLPADVQLEMYRSLEGFENAEIMRDAYAIEYDCIDSTGLLPTLMHKGNKGLFFAGQINGTSGYEEAAAQGLVAGINAALFLDGLPPMIMRRDNSYIGVMIDDLVTKGTDEPYRIMTSRAEYRLHLRQDNADLRLTPIGREVGLVDSARLRKYHKKTRGIKAVTKLLNIRLENEGLCDPFCGLSLEGYMKRHDVTFDDVCALKLLAGKDAAAVRDVYIRLRYGGYIEREERTMREQSRLESMLLPTDIDYRLLSGLRTEAAEKLNRIRPHSIGQAARIPGVNPADINVLIVRLRSI